MKIVSPGGSGFLGKALGSALAAKGHEVVVLSRREGGGGLRSVPWDGKTLGDWAAEIDGADAVVNMAGRTVNCRYNEKNKAEIYASRLDSTRVIGEAIAAAKRPPKVWLNSSTATIYKASFDRPNDEETGVIGSGFSVDVAQKWEKTLFDAPTPNTRKVALRSSMVMGPQAGGPFEAYSNLTRCGLGGPTAGGAMMVSWIHIDDFIAAIEFLIESDLEGVVNVCSPEPLTNRAFMAAIRSAMGAKIALPTLKPMIHLGALMLGTEAELPLKSRYAVPARLLKAGFEFKHPNWPEAARSIVASIRALR